MFNSLFYYRLPNHQTIKPHLPNHLTNYLNSRVKYWIDFSFSYKFMYFRALVVEKIGDVNYRCTPPPPPLQAVLALRCAAQKYDLV